MDIGARVDAARHSVAEAHRAKDVGADTYGNNEGRAAGKPLVKISDTAATDRTRMALGQNVRADQGTSSADDLSDGALQVRTGDAVDPLERAHQPIALTVGVCRCDADNRPPGHDEHDTEISQDWNALPGDVPNCPCGLIGGCRDRKS